MKEYFTPPVIGRRTGEKDMNADIIDLKRLASSFQDEIQAAGREFHQHIKEVIAEMERGKPQSRSSKGASIFLAELERQKAKFKREFTELRSELGPIPPKAIADVVLARMAMEGALNNVQSAKTRLWDLKNEILVQ